VQLAILEFIIQDPLALRHRLTTILPFKLHHHYT